MNNQQIKKYISVIRRACDLLEQQIEESVSQAFDEVIKDIPETSQAPTLASTPEPLDGPTEEEKKQHLMARIKHIDALMGIDCWPTAIQQFQVDALPTEADHVNRANAILDSTLGTSVEGATFLDYGCGDGYLASQMALRGVVSTTGYDIIPSEVWQKLGNEKVNYTCDVNSLPPKGYDLIFLYDVLDHASDPIGVLSHVKYLAAPGATIYVRCHPWTSKHASHLPKFGNNRAYIHLFLTYEELVERGFKPLFTRIEKNPMEAYRWWMKDFRIVKEQPIYDGINGFFEVPAFKELLASEQQLKPEEVDAFLERMTLQFVDFVLEA